MDQQRWQLIARVYEQALEQPSNVRPSYLADACGDDADLRREVESLLAHEQPAGQKDRRRRIAIASVRLLLDEAFSSAPSSAPAPC